MKLSTLKVAVSTAMAAGLMLSVVPLWAEGPAAAAPAATSAPAKAHKGNYKRWAKNHPERAKLNKTLRTDRQKVRADEANGTLTKAQGKADMQSINQVQHNERTDLKQDDDKGNHLQNGQGRNLNAEANGLSNNIPAPAPAAAAPAAAQ